MSVETRPRTVWILRLENTHRLIVSRPEGVKNTLNYEF